MKKTDTLSLDLFGEVRTDMPTSLPSKMERSRSSNVKKKQTEFQPSNYTAGKRLKNTVLNSYCCKMGSDPEHIPCGKYFGALPERIIINGVHWRCAITRIENDTTYDLIINTVTAEKKKLERNKLLNFLIENQSKLQ